MKPDVQKALLATAGRYIRKLFGEVEPRIKALEANTETVAKLLGRIDVLEKALAERPLPERGEKGEAGPQGVPGRDAEPVLVADVVKELVTTEALAPLIDLMVAEAVAKHFEANPVRDGKDGADGKAGEKGEPGKDGEKGDPGVGLADALIDRDGALVLTMTDGRAKALGVVVGRDGAAGADGRDGLSMADVTRTYDADAHEVVERWAVAGEQKELRYPAGGIRPGGFWREGMKCHALQAITHDGALWIAKRDTAARPCLENTDDWQLAARKGRDGRDGKDGKPPPGPVSLRKPEDGDGG